MPLRFLPRGCADSVGTLGGWTFYSSEPSSVFPLSCVFFSFFFNFLFIIVFLERGEGKEKERERNTNVWLPLGCPLLGTWPKTGHVL